MREIKFRYWNGTKMQITDFHITCFGIVWKDSDDREGSEESRILMQFTGLKDKNGVEIYEGDICKVSHDEGLSFNKTYTDIGEVEFSKASFAVKCKSKQNRLAKDESKRYFYLSFNDKRQFEVIGNIYQNPELLTL